jgi:hypothetical protein
VKGQASSRVVGLPTLQRAGDQVQVEAAQDVFAITSADAGASRMSVRRFAGLPAVSGAALVAMNVMTASVIR